MKSTTGQSNEATHRSTTLPQRTFSLHPSRVEELAARSGPLPLRAGSRRPTGPRYRHWAAVALAAAIVQGCPVYEDYCDSRSDCAPGYRCNAYTGDCELASYGPGPACTAPTECGPGETCGQSGECLPGSCVFHGCVRGYTCSIVDGLHTCSESSAGGGPVATDAGTPTDASPSSDAGETPVDAASGGGTGDAGTDAAP
jgi:hypothetical protein